MFTVRHVESNGHESIRQAKVIWREPAEPGNPLMTGMHDAFFDSQLSELRDGAEPIRYDSGTVYVMNDAGKTVATYNFG